MPSSSSQSSTTPSSSVDSEGEGETDYAWIPWFCSLKGNEFFCEIDEEFVSDAFNLTGLEKYIPNFDSALDIILDAEPPNDVRLSEDQREMIENDAENLFGLIHSRFILTARGLQTMYDKYRQFHFGRCPRVLCGGQSILPVGISDIPHVDSVKLYCPRCEDIYNVRSARHEHLDGSFFGSTFPHLFFLTFPELKVGLNDGNRNAVKTYVPRVFGFRIHPTAYRKSLEVKRKEREREKEKRRLEKQQRTTASIAAPEV